MLNYKELVNIMQREFGPRNEPDNCFLELKSREQKMGESHYDLVQDIKKLTLLAMPNATEENRDRMARGQFLDVITDSSLRKEIYDRAPGSLDDMLWQAERSEAYKKLERTRVRGGKSAHSRALGAERGAGGQVTDVQKQVREGFLPARDSREPIGAPRPHLLFKM